MTISRIIVRVYGIWIDENNEVLLSKELYKGNPMTKFPGGGLEMGEGPIEGLKREWKEELGVDIDMLEHFYTTDFFQKSAFHEDAQILSIYYRVAPEGEINLELDAEPEEGKEAFRKIHLNELAEDDVTFPIDKVVVSLLRRQEFCAH